MDKVLLTNVYMISFQVINFDFVQHNEIEDIVVNCTQMERKHGLQGINDSHSFVWFWQHDRPYTVGWQSSTSIFFISFRVFHSCDFCLVSLALSLVTRPLPRFSSCHERSNRDLITPYYWPSSFEANWYPNQRRIFFFMHRRLHRWRYQCEYAGIG